MGCAVIATVLSALPKSAWGGRANAPKGLLRGRGRSRLVRRRNADHMPGVLAAEDGIDLRLILDVIAAPVAGKVSHDHEEEHRGSLLFGLSAAHQPLAEAGAAGAMLDIVVPAGGVSTSPVTLPLPVIWKLGPMLFGLNHCCVQLVNAITHPAGCTQMVS